MAEYNSEKFYWLKLKRDFFKRHDIQVIEAMPNGKDYVLFYLKLMVESIDHNGYLRFSDAIPYDENMLAVITNTNVDVVRSAIKMLQQLEMIDILSDQTIYMTEVEALIGSQSLSAEKKMQQRERRQKMLQGGQKVDKCPPEIELEKEIDIDIYKRTNEHRERVILDTNVHTQEKMTTYDDVLDDLQVSEVLRPVISSFIKHCHLNGKTLINSKLTDIIITLDMRYGDDDKAKIQALKDAICGGYFDIKRS